MRKLILSCFAAAGLMMAQSGSTPPAPSASQFGALQTALGLSDAQVQALIANLQAFRAASQTQMAAISAARADLKNAIAANNATAIGNAYIAIENAEKQLQALRTQYQGNAVKSLGTLTAAQQTALTNLQNAANLQPAIGQAMALDLLTPPANAAGGPGGPHGFGRGFGPAGGPGRMGHGRFAGPPPAPAQ